MIQNTLFVERYRPETLEDYIGNEGLKAFIDKCIKENDIPHLLLWGRPGSGKTTLAKLIVNSIKCDVMYINASDERNIDTVRDKIVDFASANSFNPIKVVILDEADYMNQTSAQPALRSVMETYSAKTRFILTANYVERIIEPIQSRCQTFHIEPPSKGEVAKRVASILEQEEVDYELPDLAHIVKTFYPDIRKIINAAQQSVTKDKKLDITLMSNNTENVLRDIIEQLVIKDKKAWTNIRQILADNDVQDFVPLFTGLYENAEKYTTAPADVAIHAAQYLWQNNSVADRNLNFVGFVSQILKLK